MKAATGDKPQFPYITYISIHAAREGGDWAGLRLQCRTQGISIHAAREGGDLRECVGHDANQQFQSTPPVKAATEAYKTAGLSANISIHAAREGGDLRIRRRNGWQRISIHAAREGGDVIAAAFASVLVISIHAAREGGDHTTDNRNKIRYRISIHAAREGGDKFPRF